MKKAILLFLFLSVSAFAQDYDKNWKKIYQFEYEGKIKSASEEVDKVYRKAHRNSNQPEIIKTFFYQSKFSQTLQEEAQYKIIESLKTELKTKDITSRSIFQFLYAKLLSEYYNRNRYGLKQKTATDSIFNPDLRTWSYADFEKEIKRAFDKSIENEAVLLQTPLRKYEKIIVFGKYENDLNRSLYDFLAEKYLEDSRNYIYTSTKEISFINENIDVIYGNTEAFQKLKINSTLDQAFCKKLSIYQKLEKNYASQNNDLALSNTITKRIEFIAEIRNKPEEYLSVLERFAKNTQNRYKNWFLSKMASIYHANASKEKNPDYNKKAIAIYNEIIALNIEPYSSEAKNQKQTILSKNLSITTEKYVVPNQYNRALVNFKDVDTIYGKLYKIPQEISVQYRNDNYYNYDRRNKNNNSQDSLFVNYANKNKVYKTFTIVLPNKNDHFQYSTEVVLPELEIGSYLLIMNTKKDSLSLASTYSYTILNASELVLTYTNNYSKEEFQILNRKTGKPLENAIIKTEDFAIKTNINGIANHGKTMYNGDYKKIEVIHENDTLSQKYYPSNWNFDEDKPDFDAKVKLFTDRAIYRPGQTVYFKGILLQTKNNKLSIVSKTHINIIAKNTNHEEIYKTRLETNEFGSVTGEFIIPKNSLTGEFSINAEEDDSEDYEKDIQYDKKNKKHPFWDAIDDFKDSEIEFQVEEYKRPKFEITFDPVKDNFIVNQNIKIKGKAKAFAGSNISDAKVVYTVSRNSYYDNWYYSRNYNSYDNSEITDGETTTDTDGNFEVEFKAIPSDDFNEKGLPIFRYTIKAEITDSNGETRTNETQVNVGYHTLVLSANVPKIMNAKNRQVITLNSQNLNKQFTPANCEISIYKLKSPNRVLKTRSWQAPEIQTIPENEFTKMFPSEPYNKENDIEKWEKGDLVFNQKINTETVKQIILSDLNKWISGEYEFLVKAKDAFGKEIEIKSRFKLVKNDDKKLADNQLFYFETINENPKKDGFITLKMTSAAPLLYVTTQAFYNSKFIFNKTVELKNGEKIITIPIDKNYKDDVKITMDFIWESQSFTNRTTVFLPESIENLNIETISMRSKIEPGSNETWSFSIKDQNKKGALVETLASMYDASLDQFTDKKWDTDFNFRQHHYNNAIGRQVLGLENNDNISLKNLYEYKTYSNNYQRDQLNWFGFDFMNKSLNNYNYKEYLTEKLLQFNGKIIKGIVSDKTGPLPGASIVVVGTNRGTQTDIDGRYQIEAFAGETLEVSLIGMKSQYVTIKNNTINVNLDDESSSLSEVVVQGYKTTKYSASANATTTISSETIQANANTSLIQTLQGRVAGVNIATGSGTPGSNSTIILRGASSINTNTNPLYVIDGEIISGEEFQKLNPNDVISVTVLKNEEAKALYGSKGANGVIVVTTKKSIDALKEIKARKNLSETAFFYPQLQTDVNGNLKFKFTSPEALTQWKLRLFAHNKKGISSYFENSIITQKDLMILPNVPRFLREKDTITITSKIANITPEAKTGIAMLQLFDATTMQPVDVKMGNEDTVRNFNIKANGNTTVSWKLFVPEGLQGIQYKILAKAGNFTDGEENILPVLTNNILVTESIPIWVRGNTKKEYTFENFKNNTSSTLRNHMLTLEYTSNPAWFAIQSLPYLMEYEHECAEQTFSRYYANTLASEIVTSNPKIAAVFEAWIKSGKPISKLEQNEELKSLLLAETPWIRDIQNEEQQKKNLALLFDLEKMKTNIDDNFEKLDRKQSPNGGFAWFYGGPESEYITRHIVTGLGHLEKLKISNQNIAKFRRITNKAVPFIDSKFLESNKQIEVLKKQNKIWNYNTYSDLHYLYARSFYIQQNPINDSLKKAIQTHLEYTKLHWLDYSLYQKAMAALVLNRFNEIETAKKILVNLKETAINNEENGMYWIENQSGWYWYQAPIEIQALLIEAFTEVGNDEKAVEDMKVWLLKNRETKSWRTTKATTEAVYALLLQGKDWLSIKDNTVIKVGDEKIMTKKLSENEKEAGSGYIKLNWKANEIKKNMATVTINNKTSITGFGGFYWQYFEDLEKIKTSQDSPMTIEKELYLKVNTVNGKELQKITDKKPLKIGDLVTVRLIIYTKEDMEFVHLKDMRASCFEPVDVISEHKWENGIGFYQSTKDAATHFFFDNINKGKYVLEYDIRVNNSGDFSNGITTIESMYAPEFSSHTKGIRVEVKE